MEKNNNDIRVEVLDKVNKLAAAAFGLVAALAWNDAIQSIFKIYFPTPEESIWAKVVYATVITVIVVVVTIVLARGLTKARDLVGIAESEE
jgi:heme/copper-type cytochrome/quinol oxidase subunit 2